MGEKLPKLTAKDAEKLLLQAGFEINRQKGVIEFILKIAAEWSFLIIVGKFSILKSSKNYSKF